MEAIDEIIEGGVIRWISVTVKQIAGYNVILKLKCDDEQHRLRLMDDLRRCSDIYCV